MLLSRLHEHKNPNFVLEMSENGWFEAKKRTKTPILCSGKLELAPGREEISIEKRKVAFLQITAHASKMQMPHNQIINFYSCARWHQFELTEHALKS